MYTVSQGSAEFILDPCEPDGDPSASSFELHPGSHDAVREGAWNFTQTD